MNRGISNSSVCLCEKAIIALNPDRQTRQTDKAMDILARRLTIISMLMVVFAITLAAAVSADTQRRRHNFAGSLADCTVHTAQFCEQAKL
jgi:hypothetical protein